VTDDTRATGFGFQASGFGFRVSGFGFRGLACKDKMGGGVLEDLKKLFFDSAHCFRCLSQRRSA
jgi:hypothetical protein